MMMVNAKTAFWSIKCPCGASLQVAGNKIEDAKIIQCQNCGLSVDLMSLKGAVHSLFTFQDFIVKANKYQDKHWEITPPDIISLLG